MEIIVRIKGANICKVPKPVPNQEWEQSKYPISGSYCHYYYHCYYCLFPCEPSRHHCREHCSASSSWNEWIRSTPAGWGFRATQDDPTTTTTSREWHSHNSERGTSHPAESWKPMSPSQTSAAWMRPGGGGSQSPGMLNWQSSLTQQAKQWAGALLWQKLSLSSPDSKALKSCKSKPLPCSCLGLMGRRVSTSVARLWKPSGDQAEQLGA